MQKGNSRAGPYIAQCVVVATSQVQAGLLIQVQGFLLEPLEAPARDILAAAADDEHVEGRGLPPPDPFFPARYCEPGGQRLPWWLSPECNQDSERSFQMVSDAWH